MSKLIIENRTLGLSDYQSLDYYKKKGTLEGEKESGWYYFK